MSDREDSRSPSYDPSVSTIENRVFIYDPDTNAAQAGSLDEDDDDDMDYMPAEESLEEGAEEDDMDDADFEGEGVILKQVLSGSP